MGCGVAVSAGGLVESGFCARSARGAPSCVSCTRRSPTPPLPQGALCAHFGLGFAVVFSQGRLSLDIQRLPCPVGAALGALILWGTVWVHSVPPTRVVRQELLLKFRGGPGGYFWGAEISSVRGSAGGAHQVSTITTIVVLSIITRVVLLWFELGAVLGVCWG